jgi:hypothetical protein
VNAGPWKACRSHETFGENIFDIEDGDKPSAIVRIESATGTVAAAHDLFKFDEDDASLIVAAPDMYALLVRVAAGQNVVADIKQLLAKVAPL